MLLEAACCGLAVTHHSAQKCLDVNAYLFDECPVSDRNEVVSGLLNYLYLSGLSSSPHVQGLVLLVRPPPALSHARTHTIRGSKA